VEIRSRSALIQKNFGEMPASLADAWKFLTAATSRVAALGGSAKLDRPLQGFTGGLRPQAPAPSARRFTKREF
jgi:hypothetical protein